MRASKRETERLENELALDALRGRAAGGMLIHAASLICQEGTPMSHRISAADFLLQHLSLPSVNYHTKYIISVQLMNLLKGILGWGPVRPPIKRRLLLVLCHLYHPMPDDMKNTFAMMVRHHLKLGRVPEAERIHLEAVLRTHLALRCMDSL